MNNRDTEAGWRYHDGTKHPYGALMDPWHRFNPATQPLLLKKYLKVESVPLPRGEAPTGVAALEALAPGPDARDFNGKLDLGVLSGLLHYSAGITKRWWTPWGEQAFRAAACTGALYHIELYVVCGDLQGLPAGVYHYDPEASALDRLRAGDYRCALAESSGDEPAVAGAQAVLVYGDVFFRNACKYQARAYRHAFWDSGTILSHTLAMAQAYDLPARVVLGFVDREVDALLGLDGRREASLALVPIGRGETPGPAPAMEALRLETEPISRREILFPAIEEMHRASSLADRGAVRAWRSVTAEQDPLPAAGDLIPLAAPAEGELPAEPVEAVIRRRGSSRRFAREPIGREQLAVILMKSTGGFPADYAPEPGGLLFNRAYVIVHAVDGLAPGAYVYHRDRAGLELVVKGDFRRAAGQLGLGQALAADASANVYFLADLAQAFEAYGNRGYRAAQLEASVAAGRMYLAAYALHLGATGLTFFDDQVVRFFSPHAEGRSVMFLMALGVPARRG